MGHLNCDLDCLIIAAISYRKFASGYFEGVGVLETQKKYSINLDWSHYQLFRQDMII